MKRPESPRKRGSGGFVFRRSRGLATWLATAARLARGLKRPQVLELLGKLAVALFDSPSLARLKSSAPPGFAPVSDGACFPARRLRAMKKPTFFGKYLLLERINVGGMAEVFIAKAFGVEGFERILAIKKILPTMAEDEEFITMFIDEARISVQLNHANIVHIHELGKHDDTYFIAMEYVAGRDLRTLLERYRRRKEIMPTAQAVFIASKMCEGLDYAHRKKDARGQDLQHHPPRRLAAEHPHLATRAR